MPKGVIDKIIRLQCNFLWASDDKRRGIPLVNWKIIQKPKNFGGLGVGDLFIKNNALLFKWWWKFSDKSSPLWKESCVPTIT